MRYGSTLKATDFAPTSLAEKVVRALLFFIPSANPDYEELFQHIRKWILEVDEDGTPTREIAVDKNDQILFRSPDGGNLGFWTDTDVKFSAADLEPISDRQFETLWNQKK